MAYCTSTSGDLIDTLAGAVSALVTEQLDAGAQEIDEAFAAAGYATPINTTALTALSSDAGDRLLARLANTNRAITVYRLSSPSQSTGKRGTSDRVEKDYENARAWLDKVAARAVLFPVLESISGGRVGSVTGLSVAGDAETKWHPTDDEFALAHAPID